MPTCPSFPELRARAEAEARLRVVTFAAIEGAPCAEAGDIATLVPVEEALLRDTERIASQDALARLVAAKLGYERVEGAVWHPSWRGYLELHVWTRDRRGRACEVSFGERFAGGSAPGSSEGHTVEVRCEGLPLADAIAAVVSTLWPA